MDGIEMMVHMRQNIDRWTNEYLGIWRAAGGFAIEQAPQPAEKKESDKWWVVALVGNLAWAAVSFGSSGVGAGLFSLGAAFVGSGGLQKLFGSDADDESEEDPRDIGKRIIDDLLTQHLGNVRVHFTHKLLIDNYAGRLLNEYGYGMTDPRDPSQTVAAKRHFCTKMLFPGVQSKSFDVNYAERDLKRMMLEEMTGTLAEFNRQFKQWKKGKRKTFLLADLHFSLSSVPKPYTRPDPSPCVGCTVPAPSYTPPPPYTPPQRRNGERYWDPKAGEWRTYWGPGHPAYQPPV